jgi:NitT/TauT family transport system substrate-binding protein
LPDIFTLVILKNSRQIVAVLSKRGIVMVYQFIRKSFVLLAVVSAAFITVPAHAQLEPMLVPLTDVSTNKLPYIVAKEQGLFEKYGINIQLYMTPHASEKGAGDGMVPNPEYVDDPEGERLISTGGGVGVVTRRIRDGGDRVIIGTTGDMLSWWVYAREGINSIEDLKGKVLSATGIDTSCTGGAAHILAKRMGWEIGKDITLLENHEHRVDKMLEGLYDAVIVSELPDVYAKSLGLKPLVSLRDWGLPYACSGISAGKEWMNTGNNRDLAKRFLMATIEAISIMKKHPETVYQALDKWYGVTDTNTQREMYTYIDEIPEKPYPSVRGIQVIMDTFDSPEMQKHKVEDFYDNSLMQEIEDSGFIDSLYQ